MTAQELKEARLKLGFSMSEMARQLNTPRGTYKKWEEGDRRVPGILEVALLALPRKII